MDALELIKTRRSTRKFKDQPVEKDLLDKVIEAGRYAPSGGNSQTTRMMVVTNKEILAKLAEVVQAEFAKMEVTPGMYKSMVNSIKVSKTGKYVFHYNPAALIITANKIDYGNNMVDCACVLENMMIEANALDLGSVWINQLRWLGDNEEILKFMYEFGMEKDERVYGALAVGYADTEDGMPPRKPLGRTGNPVHYVD